MIRHSIILMGGIWCPFGDKITRINVGRVIEILQQLLSFVRLLLFFCGFCDVDFIYNYKAQ